MLFVGTKKQARDAVKDVAEAAGMPYVNHRWLGGLLTNFQTISQRIRRLHDLERYEAEGQLALLPTRERLAAEADLAKLRANLGGVKHMQRPPDAMFVIDLKTEVIAVHEAQRLRIPIIGLVDTNCDPDGIDYVVPGNDDAIRSCDIIARSIGDVVREGNLQFHAREEQARQDAAEQQRRAAEEQARREAEAAAAQAGRRRGRGGRRRRRRGARARGRGRPRGGRRRGGRRAGPRRPGAGRGAGPRGGRPTAARRRGRGGPEGGDRGRARATRQRQGRVAGPRPARQRPHPRRRLPGGGDDDGGHPRMSTPTISAAQVKELRQQTGAGMMDCKNALQEAGGDVDKAVELLRVRMGNKIGKLADREAAEGTIQSYIHATGKVGVLVEVDCNTDFVARNEDFVAFARDVALHIAASPTVRHVSDDEVPEDAKAAETRVFEQQAADKPEQVRPRIVQGMLDKWLGEVVLLRQEHVNPDKHEGKTIEQLRADLSAKTGENVVIRRFARFAVGE